ncbi:MAG: hypothetical protein SOR23_01955 [Candidatus Enterosoma sp.]|nr:hypothetical protein [Bacilli bacterium]MDD7182036.1 hypothetical protein [Bacilli bacterium]MDY3046994.1 hypothetical protein [Candidatus Enterosoma sp.]
MTKLDVVEEKETVGGEAITLTAIMAILAIGLVTVICYKLFFSEKGKTTLPGGFSFSWE